MPQAHSQRIFYLLFVFEFYESFASPFILIQNYITFKHWHF